MMTKTLLIAAVLMVVAYILSSRGRTSGKEARRLVESGARLIDVRTHGEFESGHIPGALNIPVQDLDKRMGEVGEKADPIVLYCRSGARSGRAMRMLKSAGYTTVYDLGPMSAW